MKRVAALVGLALALVTPRAFAQSAAAEAAFAEGRALMKQGRYEQACPKLEASNALEPAVGTLLNLGECLSQTGRTASAWLRYREAAALALRLGQREREAIARARAQSLEESLCRMSVRAPRSEGLSVTRDGAVVTAELDLAVPVDPGEHVIEATAPGRAPFKTAVRVSAPASGPCPETVVDVVLEADGSAVAPPPPPVAPVAAPVAAPSVVAPPAGGGWSTVHTLAVAAGGAGVAAGGIGAAFALSAASTRDSGDARCTAAGCSEEGRSLLRDAGQRADVATVAVVVSGGLVVTGVVLWLVAPKLRTHASAVPGVITF